MSLDALEQQLLDILTATNAEQRAVIDLLDAQHTSMVQRDLTRLSELATSLVGRAESLQQLEQQRASVTRHLVDARDDLDAQPSLRQIADGATSPERRARMLELRGQLLETQQLVATARDRNQTLAGHVLEANDGILNELMNALRESGDNPEDRPRVLDRRA